MPFTAYTQSGSTGDLSWHTSDRTLSISPDANMKQELIKAARNAGLEYAYIIKDMSRSNEGTRIYVADGREELARGIVLSSKNFNNKSFGKILGVSDEEYFSTGEY